MIGMLKKMRAIRSAKERFRDSIGSSRSQDICAETSGVSGLLARTDLGGKIYAQLIGIAKERTCCASNEKWHPDD